MAKRKKPRATPSRNDDREFKGLMRLVERRISELYAVKDQHPHQVIWWATSAFEIYKEQAAIFERLYHARRMTRVELDEITEIREEVTDSLVHLMDYFNTIVG